MSSLGRDFNRVWAAAGVSNIADGVFIVALPLFAVTLTDSPALIGGLTTAAMLPWLIFSLVAGALADRLDRRQVMVAANGLRGLLIGGLAMAVSMDLATIVVLYAIAFMLGVGETLFDTSSQSLLPSVVAPEGLTAANSRLYATQVLMGSFVGPPLGGFLAGIAGVGFLLAFGGSTAAYFVSAAALLVLAGSFRPQRARTTIRADIKEGARYLWRHGVLRRLALVTGMLGFAGSATGAIFVLYAVGPMGLSEFGFGVITSAAAVGGLAGSSIASEARRRLGARTCLVLSVLATAAFSATAAMTSNVWLVGAAMAMSGAGALVWNVIVVSIRQEIAPEELIGRVTSAYRFLGRGGRPAGALAGGLLGEYAGLRPVFAVSTVLLLACTIPLSRLSIPPAPGTHAPSGPV